MLPLKSKFFFAAAFAALVGMAAPAASAAPKDKEALELATQAIMNEYLGTQFEQASATLRKALELCQEKPGNCSNKVVAQLHRDLGVVLITGLGKVDDGKLQFAQALKADPKIQLDEDLTTDEVKAAFDEVQQKPGAGAEPGAEVPEGAAVPGIAPEGDIIHQSPTEQAILTPVPLYAELPEDMVTPKLKINVRYKPFGAPRWKTIEMTRHGKGFAAEISCQDISDVTGELLYYIQALEGGDIIAFSGSRRNPHRVMIKRMLDGEPPRIPGKPAPAQCQDIGGIPDCYDDEDCGTGNICADGKCVDSGEGPAKAPAKDNWLSAAFQVDLLNFPSQANVCGGSEDYTCFYAGGTQYFGIPDPVAGNRVNGGFGLATMRLLLGYDRVIAGGLTLGVRAGYAFGGGPPAQEAGAKKFFPLHAEARGAYWLLADSFRREGFRPYVLLSGGMAQVDGKVVVTVVNQDTEQPVPNEVRGAEMMLEAWTKKGLVFIAAGGGLMFAMSPNSGPLIEARIGQLFGASGTFIALSGGYAFGI